MPSVVDIVTIGLPALLALTGVLKLVQFSLSLARARRSRGWPSVMGTVVSAKMEVSRSHGIGIDHRSRRVINRFHPRVRYRYRVRDEDLEADIISYHLQNLGFIKATAQRYLDRYPVDARVRVFYNPRKPEQACLEPGKVGYQHLLVSLLCFLLAGVAFWFFQPGASGESGPSPQADRVESADEILARLDRDAEQAMGAEGEGPEDRASPPAAPAVSDDRAAAVRGHVKDVVAAHLAAGRDIDALDENGQALLHRAAAICQLDLLRAVLGANASPDLRTRGGSTGLHLVTMRADCEPVARALVDAGADLNARDAKGRTPLLLAIANERNKVAQLLVGRGADPNLAEQGSRTTALHLGARKGEHDLVRALIAKGAGLDSKDADGHTPLHLAAAHGRDDVVRLLLLSGADHRAEDNAGHTPLDLARSSGHTQLGLRMRSFIQADSR